jgi:acetyl-CoA carboxylase carboxyl transferase subunit alpha
LRRGSDSDPKVGRVALLSAWVRAYKPYHREGRTKVRPFVFLKIAAVRQARLPIHIDLGQKTVKLSNAMKHQLDFEKPIIELQNKLDDLRAHPEKHSLGISFEEEIQLIEKKLEETRRQIFLNLTPWQRVQLARHPKRPYTLDYLSRTFTDFQELHGDRLFADDHAMVGGLAKLGEHPVVVIGTQKGRDTKENILRNFGSAHPEGYRKALRLMRLAHKFSLPIITLIDTAGAYPGVAAEERHIAEAIAVNLREMALLEVPVIAAVIGEGGSGGALGIGVADRVLILENAYYSVISPEGCAAILWKDRANAAKAAAALKITANDLLELKLVDEIIPEPLGGAHTDTAATALNLKTHLLKHLEQVMALPVAERLKKRYAKFRAHGQFEEKIEPAVNGVAASVV